MAAPKKPSGILDNIEFPEYAPTIILVTDEPILVEFLSLSKGPTNQYGTPYIATVKYLEGIASDKDGTVMAMEVGKEYSLWLMHEVLLNQMRETKPAKNERLAIKRHSKRANKDGTQEYTPYSVVAVDRTQEATQNLSWDSIDDDEPGF